MKLTILFTAIAFFQVQASGIKAQTVSISVKEMSLKQVFAVIEKQTDYVLMNPKGTFEKTRPVTVTVRNMPLKEFLDFLLKDEELEYEIQGKIIMLSRKAAPATVAATRSEIPDHFKNDPVKGIVTNEKGLPLSQVSIFLKRSNKGTYSDNQGKFSIQANKGDTLVFSMVGYSDQIVKIPEGSMIIRMKQAHSVLDEKLVTAYGKTSKRLATGSINTIKGEDIADLPVFNVFQAMAGRVPGMVVQPRNGNSAGPVAVSIRGIKSLTPNTNLDPLYVVDGLPLSNINASRLGSVQSTGMGAVQAGLPYTFGENPLNHINPQNIESITILKDADATAMYGSRGANGVILITTKKGKAGPLSVSFSLQSGISMVQRYPRLLNTKEYLAVRREAFQNDGLTMTPTNAMDLMVWDSTKYTDWQKYFIGTGINTNANLNVSGGGEQSTYSVSAGYGSDQPLLNAGGKNTRINLAASYNYTSSNRKFLLDIITGISATESVASPVQDPSRQPPNAPDVYDANGQFNYIPYRTLTGNIFNFFTIRKKSISKMLAVNNSLTLQYKILKSLAIKATGSLFTTQNDNVRTEPEAAFDPKFFTTSFAFYGSSRVSNWQLGTEIAYNTFIGNGSLNAQLITEYASIVVNGVETDAIGFPNDAMMKSWNNATIVSHTPVKGYNKVLKFTGLLNYNWGNKYILSLSGTRDGSPHFGKGKRFGNFGSVAGAWLASEEGWAKRILPSFVSLLKFRGSFGITGSSNIAAYENLSRWAKTVNAQSGSKQLIPYQGINAFHVVKPLNQEYHWVSNQKSEIALELGFFKDRLSMSLATYREISSAQLAFEKIPLYTGFSDLYTNIYANLRNSGVEISISGKILEAKNLSIEASFNISRNRNKLIDFHNLNESPHKGRYQVGYSTSTVFVLNYTGINPLTGTYTFEDRNKDGRISEGSGANRFPISETDDRYIPIETLPKYTGGGGVNLRYRSFTLNLSVVFASLLREDPYLRTIVGSMANTALPREILDNHWKQPGDIVKYPKFTTFSDLGPISNSNAYYVNGSYVSISGMTIGWQLPSKWISKIGLKSAGISAATNNLLNFSPFHGLDPQTADIQSASPIPRTISTGLNITF